MDKKGEFSWTLLVNSHGHFCLREVLFLGEFLWTFLGEFSWTFLANFRGHVRAVCLLIETEGYHGSLYVKSNHAIELNTSDSLGDHWSL